MEMSRLTFHYAWGAKPMNNLRKYVVLHDCLFIVDDDVHEAGEDILFLLDNIDFNNSKKCLEIGVGMGLGAVYAAKRTGYFWGVDINSEAVKCTIKNCAINDVDNAHICQSDCFANVFEKEFDIIFANPPQLPTPPYLERLDTIGVANNGGEYGRIVLDEIINQCREYLCLGGCLYLLHFDMCDIKKTFAELNKRGFEVSIVASKRVSCGKLSFERLHYIKSFYSGVIYENGKYYYEISIVKARRIK